MKEFSTGLTIVITLLCSILGYTWCFTDTMMGGYIPLLIITLAPVVTNIVGRIANKQVSHL